MRKLRALEDGLFSLQTIFQAKAKKPGDPNAFMERTLTQAHHWRKVAEEFDEAAMLVRVVCGKKLGAQCDEFGAILDMIAAKIIKNDLGVYSEWTSEMSQRSVALTMAIRKELDVE